MSDTKLGMKPDEPLTIGVYPWETRHAMWLLEHCADMDTRITALLKIVRTRDDTIAQLNAELKDVVDNGPDEH